MVGLWNDYIHDNLTDPVRQKVARMLEDPESDVSKVSRWFRAVQIKARALETGECEIDWKAFGPRGEEYLKWEELIESINEKNEQWRREHGESDNTV